ncbi:MAG: hypothetical protein AAF364_02190 [Pseudomonadota bacterium]
MRYFEFFSVFISSLYGAACLFSSTACANTNERPIVVSAAYWKEFTNRDNTGVYFELLDEVFDGYTIHYQTSTYPRALNQFKQHKADVMVGVYQHDLPDAVYATWILDTDLPIHIFYRPDSPPSDNLNEIFIGKQVAWRKGYGFDSLFPNIESAYPLDTIEAGFELVLNRRLDYMLDYDINYLEAYHGRIHHKAIREGDKLYLAFKNTPRGKALAAHFDATMPLLRDSGKLEEIYGSHYDRSGLAEFAVLTPSGID